METRELIPTRKSLLERLRNWDDHESWRVFFDTYWRLIYSLAVRAGLNNEEAEEVVQETIIAVMKKMPTFEYDARLGSFKGWLLQLTRWRILDQLRHRGSMKRGVGLESGDCALEDMPDPAGTEIEAVWDAEWETNLLSAAVDRVKRKVDPQQYQVFDLCVIKGWSVSKVSQTLRLNRARVSLIKHRVSRMIKAEVARLRARPVEP